MELILITLGSSHDAVDVPHLEGIVGELTMERVSWNSTGYLWCNSSEFSYDDIISPPWSSLSSLDNIFGDVDYQIKMS